MVARSAVDGFLQSLCAARVAGDAEALGKMLGDDVTFQIVGFEDKVTGKAAFMAALRQLIEDFHFVEWRPIHVIAEGDSVAMRCVLKVRHRSKERMEETETADFIELRDGKIVSYVQYADTRLATELTSEA
jgi:ketosteroid isomerase-like protein